jgi:hypothetical protein
MQIGIARIISRRRVSRIVPANRLKRALFTVLRCLFGDAGSVAVWTRNWRGPWQVRWILQPRVVAYQHMDRKECLTYERTELNRIT